MTLEPYGAPIDLSNCDREPIHIPGQIQAHGALLAVERASMRIVQVSENVASILGRTPTSILGLQATDLFTPANRAALERSLVSGALERAPLHVFRGSVGERGPFDVIAHADGPILVLELDAGADEAPEVQDFYAFASRAIAALQSTPTTRDYCHALAGVIRDLTGYDRVMIYRFAEDWSGHVWAESMVEGKGLAPFLDLHYPASDIPSQARALFLKNTVRMLVDAEYRPSRIAPEMNPVTGSPLDMSQAFLRGASQMYTEYLVNMGVRASLTLALVERDRLWGLVACHHYGPRYVSYGARVACELLARVASLQIVDKLHGDEAAYRARIQAAHGALVEAMANGPSVGAALAKEAGAIRSFVDCTGVAIVSGGQVHTEGEAPPSHHVRRIADLLSATAKDEVVATERLASIYPEANGFEEGPRGMLALPLPSGPGEYVFWFRPEVLRTVSWAGDPHKPVTIGPLGDRLTPRKSFELWTETVRGASEPWSRLEIESAKRLRTSFIELALRRSRELERLNLELSRSNDELDSFAYVASHDLKEPLRGIYNYAEFLMRDARDKLSGDDVKKLERIVFLSRRMRGLIDSLLEYSRAGRLEVRPVDVPLGPVVALAIESMASTIAERSAVVRIANGMPAVKGVPRFFDQIFTNLITNAVKYSDKPVPEIDIGFVRAGNAAFPERARGAEYAFFVKDNGIGIAERHLDTVFRIFKRLHAQDKFGGGSGAGLTIVKKLVDRLGGRVWIESIAGRGTTVWFTTPPEKAADDHA